MPIYGFKRHRRRASRAANPSAKSRVAWAGVLLAAILAEPALEHARITNDPAGNGDGVTEPGTVQRNPLLYLAQRSPGARVAGLLRQTKNRVAAGKTKAVKPHERVLANVRYAPPNLTTPEFINDIVANTAPLTVAPATILGNPSFPLGIGSGPAVLYSGGGGGGGGGTGGGGTSGGGTSGGGTGGGGTGTGGTGGGTGGGVTPPAVPEPGTWLMLVLGMFVAGAGLRSTHRRRRKTPGVFTILDN